MSKSSAFEAYWLDLVFFGTAIPNIADNAAVSPLTNLYIALHSADPGNAGDQTTNEVTTGQYDTYARVAVARSGSGWSRTGSVVSPLASITFAAPTGGTGVTATYMSIGTAPSGAGMIIVSGPLSPTIAISSGGSAPTITTGTTYTED